MDSITNFLDDSLYIDDENVFYREYKSIFDRGIYNNLECGVVDTYGINYYAPSLIDPIIEKLREKKPIDYEPLIALPADTHGRTRYFLG